MVYLIIATMIVNDINAALIKLLGSQSPHAGATVIALSVVDVSVGVDT